MEKTIAAIISIVQELYSIDVRVQLDRPDPKFGDYSTNVALQLAKQVGKNPRDIATEIVEKLKAMGDYADVIVAGPGFINLTLGAKALLDLTRLNPEQIRQGQTVVIETNNPNPFKAMHIGHAYNAILADTMANLLAVSAATVRRVSYHLSLIHI